MASCVKTMGLVKRSSPIGARVLVLCIGVALLQGPCFTSPVASVQRSQHVKRAAKKSSTTRLKDRLKSFLGRDLEPEDFVVKHQVVLEVPSLKENGVGTGDSPQSASNQAADYLLSLLDVKALPDEAKPKGAQKSKKAVPDEAKPEGAQKPKKPRLFELGQSVTVEMLPRPEGAKGLKVRVLLGENNTVNGRLSPADFSAAFPDKEPEVGETFEARVFQTPKNIGGKFLPVAVTLQDGDFTEDAAPASAETKVLFAGLGEQQLEAEVRRTSLKSGAILVTVTSPDGQVAPGLISRSDFDADLINEVYPGMAIQVRVKSNYAGEEDKVLIPLTMK